MQFMPVSVLLKNTVSTKEWLAAATFVKYKKHCTLKKTVPCD